jgi:raffinose/stachyose/melibiose transport system permease protein
MADVRSKDVHALLVKVLFYTILIAFTVLAVFPILWLTIQSFKTAQEYLGRNPFSLPRRLYTDNYFYVWYGAHFYELFPNGILYTSVTVISVIVFGFMAAFAFTKIPSKATRFLHGSFILGILVSLQNLMIPLFLLVHAAGLYDTRAGIIIPYIGTSLSFGVYLGAAYIRGIPQELIDAARIDGTGYVRIFFLIILPLSAPAAVTTALWVVPLIWNEYIFVDIITLSKRLKSVAVGINSFNPYWTASNWGRHFAAMVIGIVPSALFYLYFRKRILKGIGFFTVQ